MKEKLIIKNFGPIKSVELELGSFNILIGENATGKSIVAKLLAVCRYFSYIIDDGLFPKSFEDGLEARGLIEFIQDNSVINYECEHYVFKSERKLNRAVERDENGEFMYETETHFFSTELVPKSGKFENLLKELRSIQRPENLFDKYALNGWNIPTSFFQNDVAAVLDNPFFVPTERGLQSIFSLGKNSIQNLSDALFNQLAELDQIARAFKDETKIEPLNIIYKNENGKGYIKKDTDDTYYSLFNAASGYQSTIPIVLLLKYYSDIRKKSKTFIIEEPELNLFPLVQYELIQFLADKTINFGNSILLTTHSPYILTSINNLMYAYKTGQNHHEEAETIIEKKYWLNPEDVSVYMLLPNGECEDIFEREEGMIKVEKIDSVSRKLNHQFDTLINIELGIIEEKN